MINGGMETFSETVPIGWSVNSSTKVRQVTAQGRVHSGNSAANLNDGAVLSQTVTINGGCYYNFSFFVRGEGAQVGFTAKVIFRNSQNQDVTGLTITVRQQDLTNSNREFGYFRGITIVAPNNTVSATIQFTVDSMGNQTMDLDDVSFTVA